MRRAVQQLLQRALREDGASCDLTSRAVIPDSARIRARLVAKASGVLAGSAPAVWTFRTVDPSLRCTLKRRDGARLFRGDTILTVEGRARSIFAAERTALNLLMHLSGIATLTRAFVEQTRGTRAKIYDTRKTLPGLRLLEKYAVRVGGGCNHRLGLDDAVLIKTNHLRVMRRGKFGVRPPRRSQEAGRGSSEFGMAIRDAVANAKRAKPRRFVEIEVTNLREFTAACQANPDAILLDNWTLPTLKKAVLLRHSASSATLHGGSAKPFGGRILHPASPLLEVSGGVTLADVRAIAKTGVDRISIGRLTHSAPALDMSLRVL